MIKEIVNNAESKTSDFCKGVPFGLADGCSTFIGCHVDYEIIQMLDN